ncbi:MAG: hypothetical protein EAZ70_06955 [Runella slithyformis]|nr:MAG: hypothetical protein EAY79_06315 [Runella slithyformis]TAE99441.1 MAG: hypothetical protein EAZ80_04895 [Runella slithyformis]TAF27538.1 MAG: hypothetical protein EAZ70_06955 [Runella slithyformis]TAF46052.1 MAG: hypothetical protein EAZ63_09915 [Runella slithyformis]TAF82234.1 MAG: hypothetical protein EAZ50_04355 [Runella slithyformis]
MNPSFDTAHKVSFRLGLYCPTDALVIGKTGNDTIRKQLTFMNSYNGKTPVTMSVQGRFHADERVFHGLLAIIFKY